MVMPKVGQRIIVHEDKDRIGVSEYRCVVLKSNENEGFFVAECSGWARFQEGWLNINGSKYTLEKSTWEPIDEDQEYQILRNQAREVLKHYKSLWEECKQFGKRVGLKNIITKSIADALGLNEQDEKIKEALKEYREIMESIDA